MIQYLVAAAVLAAYLALTWFLGSLLNITGTSLVIFRVGLALIGIAAFVIFVWFRKKESRSNAGAFPGGSEPTDPIQTELDEIFREAAAQLKSAQLAKGLNLRNLPSFYVVGDSNSAKTSSIVNSGLDPTLLAGQVYQDTTIKPTHSANLWFVRNAVIIEASSNILSSSAGWLRLLRLLQPKSVDFLKSNQVPRAVVLCISCEQLLAGNTDTLKVSARNIRARLDEMSRQFGIRFPVYVLFTKLDHVPFFPEFARNLNGDEASDVLGLTLPRVTETGTGVFAEEQTRLLNSLFNDLFLSLCEKRVDLLLRETDTKVVGGIYEFPRELRKLRQSIVQLLVDIGRPSPLIGGPFVRGFYFSGVRPVLLDEREAPIAAPDLQPTYNRPTDATVIFSSDAARAKARQSAIPGKGSRRVPQWTFLGHLFTKVLLKDTVALSTSGSSSKTTTVRRALLASAAIMAILLSTAFTVSYFGNRNLQSKVIDAARAIQPHSADNAVPTLDELKRLDTLRQSVETLAIYNHGRHPRFLGWGLYSGDDIYIAARRLYFEKFRQALFASTQSALIASLRDLPNAPQPTDDYNSPYDTLRSYLITTTEHARSTSALAQVLLARWSEHRTITPEQMKLAKLQFEFYSDELRYENPYSTAQDTYAVTHARQYLVQFSGLLPIYQALLSKVSKMVPSQNFNRLFPNNEKLLIDDYEVKGPYTKDGWRLMQEEIKKTDQAGEEWVLGKQETPQLDPATLEQKLRQMYTEYFIKEWREFIRNGKVVDYSSIPDAANKLKEHASNQSPILAMLCLASEATSVDPEMKTAFDSVQYVVPTPCMDRYVKDINKPYLKGLEKLQSKLHLLVELQGSEKDKSTNEALSIAEDAISIKNDITREFKNDPSEYHLHQVVDKLLEKPISSARDRLKNFGQADLNEKGGRLCSQFRDVARKYPFNSDPAAMPAKTTDLDFLFQPRQGVIWKFFDENLKDHLEGPGGKFGPKPGDPIKFNPAFLTFWNNAISFAETIYADNSMHLEYRLRAYPVERVPAITLSIGGQTVTASGSISQYQRFVWSGKPESVQLSGVNGIPEIDGVWAVFQFFGEATKWTSTGNVHTLEWILGSNLVGRPAVGNQQLIRFDLDMGAAPPIFKRTFLNGLSCVSKVAQ